MVRTSQDLPVLKLNVLRHSEKIERSGLAEAIRELRARLEQTQQEFAVRLGLNVGSVARYETNALPSARVIRKMRDLSKRAGFLELATFFAGECERDHLAKTRVRKSTAEAIRRLRIALGQSQVTFAARLGVSAASLAKYETDRKPPANVLAKLVSVARENKWEHYADVLSDSADENFPFLDRRPADRDYAIHEELKFCSGAYDNPLVAEQNELAHAVYYIDWSNPKAVADLRKALAKGLEVSSQILDRKLIARDENDATRREDFLAALRSRTVPSEGGK